VMQYILLINQGLVKILFNPVLEKLY